jgi:uncharacterized protein (TIGR03790 family)
MKVFVQRLPRRKCLALFTSLVAAVAAHGADSGKQVIVVYNTRVPESKEVADYYARCRNVPTNQIFGFALTPAEEMTRAEFRDSLQKPLADLLNERNLWKSGTEIRRDTNGKPARVEWKVVDSKIRYAVLCYGVPVRIARDPGLLESIEEKMRPELRRNEAAVDSELALLPCIDQDLPLAGPLRNPVYGATNTAAFDPTNGVLMVTRLDGPDASIARGLVDKALEAERDGLWGRAYFDLRNISDPGYKMGDDWIRGAAEICRRLGFETVVDDKPTTFPPEFPMSQIAIYCGWYDGRVSGPFTRPHVEFMPGAFAYHLHSYSAANLRSRTENWVGPLLAKGATISMGCVTEPYLSGTPEVAVFLARFIYEGMSFGEAAYAAQPVLSWQTTIVGDPLYRPFGRPAERLQQQLERTHSPFLDWSYLRLVDLNLARGSPPAALASYLENLALTRRSAVLTEKLGDLYERLGKPSSAAETAEDALKLDPSPEQRVRLRLTLGERLEALNRSQDAYEDYLKLLQENPDYPNKPAIYRKLLPLAKELGKKQDATRYEDLLKPPPPPPTNLPSH